MSTKVRSIKILDPVAPEYRNQFVVELEFMFGDGDHDGFEVFECNDQEELKRLLNILSELSDLELWRQEDWLKKMSKETNKWLNENNRSDGNPEISTKYELLDIWPSYEGTAYYLVGYNPVWYDKNGIMCNVDVEWEE